MFKLFFFSTAIFFHVSAFANQYIQCAGQASDRTVINLDGAKSSIYMMDGFDDESNVRIFQYISELEVTATHHVYLAKDKSVKVEIPNSVIGQSLDLFRVNLIFKEGSFYPQDCFSRIY